jgi:hypothetical protein
MEAGFVEEGKSIINWFSQAQLTSGKSLKID